MIRTIILIVGLLLSLAIYGQDKELDAKISLEDSSLLNVFWTDFKTAINTNDKVKLATLFKFPFSCRPCIDDSTVKHKDNIAIKVTKDQFNQNQYKVFFDKPIKDKVNKDKSFDRYVFHPTLENKSRPKRFIFSYTIAAASKKREGLQGIVYLHKIKGKYKITGIDTVP